MSFPSAEPRARSCRSSSPAYHMSSIRYDRWCQVGDGSSKAGTPQARSRMCIYTYVRHGSGPRGARSRSAAPAARTACPSPPPARPARTPPGRVCALSPLQRVTPGRCCCTAMIAAAASRCCSRLLLPPSSAAWPSPPPIPPPRLLVPLPLPFGCDYCNYCCCPSPLPSLPARRPRPRTTTSAAGRPPPTHLPRRSQQQQRGAGRSSCRGGGGRSPPALTASSRLHLPAAAAGSGHCDGRSGGCWQRRRRAAAAPGVWRCDGLCGWVGGCGTLASMTTVRQTKGRTCTSPSGPPRRCTTHRSSARALLPAA